ncbi:MAG: hypothetical protein ABIZ80_00790, partial [Bryobacteraceae bacterium]
MPPEATERCIFSARLDCHYLLHIPPIVDERTLLVTALHGYGSNPDAMLRLTRTMLSSSHVIASIQAPSQFFSENKAGSGVGYCWATPAHPESSVRLHHEMVLHVWNEV